MVWMMGVTLVSLVLAAVSTLIAIGVVRDDRRRSQQRIAALAAGIHGTDAAGEPTPAHSVQVNELFVSNPARQSSTRLVLMLGAGMLVVGGGAALLLNLGARGHTLDPASVEAQAAAAASPLVASSGTTTRELPLELVALAHDRENDRLTVRGLVRNPSTNPAVKHLTAVVLLFNAQGGFLTSGRATVGIDSLVPGKEATFVITVPGATDVGRYRISFRTDDRVVPHVDRRS